MDDEASDVERPAEIDWLLDKDDIDEDPGGRLRYRGSPFTGSVVERNDGAVVSCSTYVDGLADGPSQDFEHGRLVREAWYRRGGLEGPTLSFDADGSVTSVDFYARGIRLLRHERSPAGQWVETLRIDPNTPQANLARITWV